MQQTVHSLGALERRIDIAVPAMAVEKEIQSRLAKLARDMKMPGFRPGKVPMKMVVATYGEQVKADVLQDKIGEAFNSAVNDSKLRVAGSPKLEPRTVEGSNDLEFSATFEIYPEIGTVDVSGAEIKRAVCTVGDAEIASTIEMMRKQRARFEDVTRSAAIGDIATIDFKGTLAGVAFEGGSATDFELTLGQGRMLPEFETAVPGMKPGESKTFPLTFPADYTAQDLAGKSVEFEVTLKKLKQPLLPPVDAAFAQSLGIADGDLAKMRAEIAANLGREVGMRLKGRARDAAMTALLEAAKFDVPRSLVENETGRLIEATKRDLAARGVTQDAPLPTDLFTARAERQVRLGLLAGEVMRAHGLQARPDQVRKLVEEMAQSYEKPQDVINWYLSDRKRLAELEASVVEENIVNWVLEHARVSDEAVAFDELMGHAGR
jgi:trigger factor